MDGRLRTHGGSPYAGGKEANLPKESSFALEWSFATKIKQPGVLSSPQEALDNSPCSPDSWSPQGPTEGFPSNGSPSLETEGHLIAKVKGINNPSPNFKSIFLQNFSKFTLQLTHRKLGREERLVLLREGEETGLWSGICWEQCC